MNIIDYRHDQHLAGSARHMRDPATQAVWDAWLAATYGLPMSDAMLQHFKQHTGRQAPRPGGYPRSVVITGRQSGKTQTATDIVDYEAITAPSDGSADGTYCLLVAQDLRGAIRTAFHYAKAPFERVPMMRELVASSAMHTLSLTNGLTISAYPSRPQSLRGLRARVVVIDELAHMRSSENIPVDRLILRAAGPTTATTGGRQIILSSPAGQVGALWDLWRAHWGREDSTTLIWVATAPEMNPGLSATYLQQMEQDDPEGFRAEVCGEFLPGHSMLFDHEMIDGCTREGADLLPQREHTYYGGADVSGGRHDQAAAAVVHREEQTIVVDTVRAWPAPHDPSVVIREASQLFKNFNVHQIIADRYAAQFQTSEWQRNQILCEPAGVDRTGLYLHMLPLVNAQAVSLPDNRELLKELRGLERRRGGFAGRQKVDHQNAAGARDDVANACAAAIYAASQSPQPLIVPPGGEECPSLWSGRF